MVVVKLLERKSIIRLFGVALVFAPFFNILMSMSLQTNIANRWTMKVFLKIIATSSTFDHILYVASFLIGLIMLSGSMAAWRWVLVLLGGVIANQTMNLGQNFRSNWMSIPFFIVNVSVFLFILDQLAWKQKKTAGAAKPAPKGPAVSPIAPVAKTTVAVPVPVVSAPASQPATAPAQIPTPAPVGKPQIQEMASITRPQPTVTPAPPAEATQPLTSQTSMKETLKPAAPAVALKPVETQQVPQKLFKASRPSSFQTQKKVLVHFAGIGAWAQVMSISKEGLHVRSLKQPPADIHSRAIEISLKNGLHLQMRLSRQAGDDFYFGYSNLTSNDIRLLNQWLQQVA